MKSAKIFVAVVGHDRPTRESPCAVRRSAPAIDATVLLARPRHDRFPQSALEWCPMIRLVYDVAVARHVGAGPWTSSDDNEECGTRLSCCEHRQSMSAGYARVVVHPIAKHHRTGSGAHHEDRARDVGRRRREKDARQAALADASAEAEHDRRTLCLQRWPGILAAIKGLLAAYNDGAGAELLTGTEQPTGDDPALTITSSGTTCRTITIAVDEDAFLVRTNLEPHAAASLHTIARRVDCSRSDTGTAAYLLQDWMDQL